MDEYAFITRQCEVNLAKGGCDITKYSDIAIKDEFNDH